MQILFRPLCQFKVDPSVTKGVVISDETSVTGSTCIIDELSLNHVHLFLSIIDYVLNCTMFDGK